MAFPGVSRSSGRTRPGPVRKFLIALAALLPVAAILAVPAPASAHSNSVTGVVACQPNGSYTVTWTIANDWSTSAQVTEKSHTGGGTVSGLPATVAKSPGTITVTQTGISGTTKSASLTIHSVWSGYERDNSGSVSMNGKCAPQHLPVTLCHATDSNTNPYVKITVDDDAVIKDGHNGHNGPVWNPTLKPQHISWGDIIPAFDYYDSNGVLKHYAGKNLPAGASILANNCVVPPTSVTVPAPVVVDESCTAGGSITIAAVTGITWKIDNVSKAPGTYPATVGQHTVKATAQEGYTISGQSTFTVTVGAKPDCRTVVTPVEPTITAPTCTTGSAIQLPTTTGITYVLNSNNNTVTATPNEGYRFAGSAQVVVFGPYQLAGPTDECVIPVPATPVPAPATCSADGSLTLVDGAHYSWNGPNTLGVGTHVVTATADQGYLFPGYVTTATFTVTVDAATNDCPVALVDPTVVPPTCTVGGYVTLPDDSQAVSYSQSAEGSVVTVTATTHEPYVFTPKTGWVVSEDGLSATFTTTVSGPTYSCVIPVPAQPVPSAPTCSVDGSLTLVDGEHYTWDGPNTLGVGTHLVTATTDEGFYFTGLGTQVTYWVTVLPRTNDCPVTPVDPTITAQPVCTGPGTSAPGSFTVPEDSELVSYTVEGDVVTATTQAPYRFTAAQGWTVSEDGLSATFTVVFTPAGDCLVEAVPVEPVVEASASCGIEGTYTIPETVGVTYWVDGEPIAAGTYDGPFSGTISATADQGYVLPEGEWSFALELAAAEACPVIVIVTPVDPTVTQSDTCEVEGSYTIPTTAGVTYLLDGAPIAAGTYPGPASGTITASPQEGSDLVDSSWSFDLELAAAAGCAENPSNLPSTGSTVYSVGAIGVIGLLLGVLLVAFGARRRADES